MQLRPVKASQAACSASCLSWPMQVFFLSDQQSCPLSMLEHANPIAWLSCYSDVSGRDDLPSLKKPDRFTGWLTAFGRCSSQQEVSGAGLRDVCAEAHTGCSTRDLRQGVHGWLRVLALKGMRSIADIAYGLRRASLKRGVWSSMDTCRQDYA